MGLEQKFNETTNTWRDHCKANSHYSTHDRYIDCEAFGTLCDIGPSILPLIKSEMIKEKNKDEQDSIKNGDPGILWCYLIKNIVPDFELFKESRAANEAAPGWIAINVKKEIDYVIKWLEENISKYCPAPQ